nr:hypothetical protein [Pseudomonas sp. P818]
MIDPRDPRTQQLQLEQKRGRGRPATGQALSNAERQRRYREAQKAQRNENMHKEVAEDLRAELAKALEEIEGLKAKLRAEFTLGEKARSENKNLALKVAQLETQLAQRNDNELMKRVELAEARADAMGNELAIVKAQLSNTRKKRHRDDPPVDIREWAIQRQSPKGQWRTVAKYDTAAEANIALADQAGAMGHLYRVKAPK